MKAIIFDSGTLITFSMTGLLDVFRELKKTFKGKFLITKEVYDEIISKPLKIKKYKLGAMRLQTLIDDKTLEFPESAGIQRKDISRKSSEILKAANHIYIARDRPLEIIHLGEASILALSELLFEKNIRNVIAIDERTTRMLCEGPTKLKNLLEKKLHTKISQREAKNKCFHQSRFIRSVELIYIAFKKGLFKNKSKDMLDALLYGAKFRGVAVSEDEIKQIESM